MRLMSFHGETMREAMAVVRRTLGDDAIIVTTRKEAGGVRITAAVDNPVAEPAPPQAPETPSGETATTIVPAVRAALAHHGVQDVMADDLLATVHDTAAGRQSSSPATALAAALDACLRFEPVGERTEGPLMLVGAPGVGKTVTVAKLAAQARFDGRPVRVVTTDTVKSGGVSQLEALTDALRVGLRTAADPVELAAAVAGAAGGELIVIDSAGVNPFVAEELMQLARFLEAARAEPVFVLAAGADIVDAAEVATAFAELGCRRTIVTRLDIARRLGSVLGAARIAALALAEASMAPTIGSGLEPLSPAVVARLLLQPAENAAADLIWD